MLSCLGLDVQKGGLEKLVIAKGEMYKWHSSLQFLSSLKTSKSLNQSCYGEYIIPKVQIASIINRPELADFPHEVNITLGRL